MSRPLPGAVQEALHELMLLTTCYCEPAWSERGLHEPKCSADWREDVLTLRDALAACDGVTTSDGDDTRRASAPSDNYRTEQR
jgi:hypothetical protein